MGEQNEVQTEGVDLDPNLQLLIDAVVIPALLARLMTEVAVEEAARGGVANGACESEERIEQGAHGRAAG